MEENNKINSIRIEADLAVFDSPKNASTKSMITFRSGDGVHFDIVLLRHGKLVDCLGITSATFEIFDVGEINEALPRQVKLLVAKSILAENINKSLTEDEAKNGRCHFTVELSSEDTSMRSGIKYIKLCCFDSHGDRITFASGWIRVEEIFSAGLDSNSDKEISIAEILKTQIAKNTESTSNLEKSLESLHDDFGEISQLLQVHSSEIGKLNEDINCLEIQKANSATTLAGYGIADAYTKTEIDENNSQIRALVDTERENLQTQIDTNSQKHLSAENRIGALQTGKVNSGVLHFNKGTIETLKTSDSNVFSYCFTASIAKEFVDSLGADNPLVGSSEYTAGDGYGQGWLFTTLSTGGSIYFRYKNKSNASWDEIPISYFDGAPKRFVVVRGLENIRLFCDGVLLLSKAFTFSPTADQLGLWVGGYNGTPILVGKVSDVAVFNFDITADNAPYSINDYQNGKPILPYLLDGNAYFLDSTKANEAKVSGYNSFNTAEFVEGSGLESTITEAGFNASNTWTLVFIDLPITIKSGDIIDLELGQRQTIIDGTASNDSGFGANIYVYKQESNSSLGYVVQSPKSNTNYRYVYAQSESTNRIGIQYGFTKSATSHKAIFPFKIKVNGAELALENFTFNGEVLDYSGNGRHGTITGSVKGDNDTKVETLFEKFSARIANQTNG